MRAGAARRQGKQAEKIRDVRLREGDILLVHSPREKLDRIRMENDLIILEDVHHQIVFKDKSRWALAIFTGMVLAASTGLADIMVCAVTGVLLMALFGYKTNLMVYGPGRYGFGDYLKMGIPLNVLVILSGSLFIP